jgi:hypothetical protein
MTLTKPTTASDLDDAWYERVQEAIALRKPRLRASPERPTIQVWSDGRNMWQDLLLPTGSVMFETWGDRNLVWRRLMGK